MDGSFIGQTGAAGIGANGQEFIGPDLQRLNAEEAEAMAWVEGDCLATEWGPGSVIFDTDCARIVQRPNM